MSPGSRVRAVLTVAYGSLLRRLGERGVVYFRRARVVCCDAVRIGEENSAAAVTVHEATAEDLRQLSAAMGRDPSELPERQKRGRICLVARSGTECLGCVWISRSAETMTEVHRVLDVSQDPQGAYLFDGFVVPAWRGKGVLRALLAACRAWAASSGVSRLYAAFTRENHVSERALVAMGFTNVVGDVTVLRVLGMERNWVRLEQDAPMADVLRATGASQPRSGLTRASSPSSRRSTSRRG